MQKQCSQSQSEIQQGEQISQHSQSSQFIKVKYSGRTNLCQICNNLLSKYTCPKCSLKTCSLSCIRKHKDIKNCTGQKDPTQYIAKDQIDEKIVEKDYNFIQDMISNADRIKKCLQGVNNTISLQPRRFKILRNNARHLHNIKVVNGPNILERHRENISFFYVKTKSIFWVCILKCKSTQSNAKNLIKSESLITQPLSDLKNFLEILPQSHLNKPLLQNLQINTTKRCQFHLFLQSRQYLREQSFMQKIPKKIIFKTNQQSNSFNTYFQLIEFEMDQIICKGLHNVSVFQFPTLYVVHKTMRSQFIQAYKTMKQRVNVIGNISKRDNAPQRAHKRQKRTDKLRDTQIHNQSQTQNCRQKYNQRDRSRSRDKHTTHKRQQQDE